MPPLHVGIVACSAEGAALCYRTICVEGAQFLGEHAHPEVSMHTHSLADSTTCLRRDDWPGVGALMLSSAHSSPLAVLTGSRWLVESAVYPDKLTARGLEYVRSNAGESEEINRIIMDELVNGIFRPEAVACFQRVIERMKREGCDAVILGCTEIPWDSPPSPWPW